MVFAESLEYLVEEAMAICLGLEGCRAPGRGLARSSCAFVPRTAAVISPPQANYSYSLSGDIAPRRIGHPEVEALHSQL